MGVGRLFVPRLARVSRRGGGRRPSVVGLGNVVAPAGRGDRHADLPLPFPVALPRRTFRRRRRVDLAYREDVLGVIVEGPFQVRRVIPHRVD